MAILKRSVRIAGHRTSLALERPFWAAVDEIARARGVSRAALLAAIDDARRGPLASAVRVFVLEACRSGELSAVAAPPSPSA
jgi:predicted DNA-binding ribbon-helix-helix protein